jgi:PAS domain S-box-containing protein
MGSFSFERFLKLLALAVILFTILGLIGWTFDSTPVRHIVPNAFATINPLTGINLFLFSTALYISISSSRSTALLRIVFALIAVVFVTSLSVIADFLFGLNLHLDQILPALSIEGQDHSYIHSHMALNTAVNFVLCSVSLALTYKLPTKPVIHQVLILLVIAFALFVVLGYLYNVPEFFRTAPLTMAPPVAVAFILIALAVLLSNPKVGLMRELTSHYSGSRLTMYLIPASVILPVFIGYLRMLTQWRSLISLELGVTIIILSFIIIFVGLIWFTIARLNRRDELDKQNERKIASLNRELSTSIEEMASLNEELAASNEELSASNEELNANNEALFATNEKLIIANQTIARQKDEQLNRVLDSTNDVIWSFDFTGTGENYLSRSAEKVYGEPYDKLINRPMFWLEHIHPDDRAIKNESQKRLQKIGRTECTYRIQMPDGIRWIHDRLRLIHDDNGKAIRLEGIATDVTSIKLAELQLKESEINLRSILKSTLDGFLLLSTDYKVVVTNTSYQNIVKKILKAEIKTGTYIFDVLAEERKDAFRSRLEQAKVQGINQYELQQENTWYKVVITRVDDDQQSFAGYCLAIHDITSQKESENLIRSREEYIRALIENVDEVIVVRDVNQNILFASSNFNRILGYGQWDLDYQHAIHPEDHDSFTRQFKELIGHPGKSFRAAIRVRHKNGEWRWMEGITTNLCHVDSIKGIISNYRDITERKNQDLELSRYRENLEIIFSNTTDHFVLIDQNSQVIAFNQTFSEFIRKDSNKEPQIGMLYLDLVPKQRKEFASASLARAFQGESISTEAAFQLKNETQYYELRYIPVFKQGKVTHVSFSAVDITERKRRDLEINQYRENLEIIFATTTDNFLLSDASWKVVAFNQSYEKFIREVGGINIVPGMNFLDAVVPNRRDVAKSLYSKALEGVPASFETEIAGLNGERIFHLVRYEPVIRQGKVTHVSTSGIDITKRKLIEEELVRDKFFLEKASEAGNIGYWSAEADMTDGKIYWSKEVLTIFELDENDFDGKISTFFNFVHPEDQAFVAQCVGDAIEKNQAYNIDHRIILRNGKVKWVNERAQVILNEKKNINLLVGISQDITERKNIEEEKKRAQYFLEKAGEAGKIGYWTSEIGFEKGRLTWSKEVFSIFNMDPNHFDGLNSTFFNLIHPEDKERVLEMSRLAVEEKHIYNVDHRVVLKDGTVKWVNERGQIVRNEKEEAVMMVGIVQDINERKQVEEMLREYNDRYEILSKATNDVIYDWDIIKNKILYNQGMTMMFGYEEKEIMNTLDWWEERLHPEDHDRIMADIEEVFAKRLLNWEFSYRYRTASGPYKFIHDRAYVVYDMTGKPIRMIGAMQDVTEITEYKLGLEQKVEERTRELNEALSKEKELVHLKSKFISIASHEFRTPLSTILLAAGFVRKFKDRMKPEDIDKKLESVETQVTHMTALLEDVLTVGKGEADKIVINWKLLPVRVFFENLIEEVTLNTRKSHSIDLQLTSTEETFRSDEGLMRNIFINLLTNAIKFSPNANKVVLNIDCTQQALRLNIRDFGMGIPADDVPKLFQSFFRASNVTTVKGTGLGLSIVKKAVNLLGGEISVKSNLGEGTEFTVTLPLSTTHLN